MDLKNFTLNISQTKVNRFVDELAAGKFMATVCKKCGKKYYPPQADCPDCMSSDMEWKQIGNEGALVTFTKIHVPQNTSPCGSLSCPFRASNLNRVLLEF